jgi:hypothetical protein
MKETQNNKGILKKDNNTLAWLMSGLFGVLSGFFLVFGYQLEKNDSINLGDKNALLIMVMIMAVLTVDARNVWRGYEASKQGKKFLGFIDLTPFHNRAENAYSGTNDAKSGAAAFVKTWCALILLNLPVLLAEYPGFFVYDAQDELNEVITRTFTTHHPLLHVLLLGGTIALVHKLTASWNLGIFIYLFLQMMAITAIFTYVLQFLSKRGQTKGGRILWILYYGIFPTIVMFTLCSSKDGLFSALLLLLTALLIQLSDDPEAFMSNKKKIAAFVVTATLMPCFRHNGFYAYLVFIPFALLFFRKKIKSILPVMLIAPVILYFLISTVLSKAFTDGETHHQEMLTVPIMQLTRAYTYEKDSFSKEELETIKAYIPSENLDLYSPRVSDLVKVGFNNDLYEENSGDFWKLWFSQLKKQPMTYVNAALLTSYGYWYPAARINVYKGTTVFTFTYEDSSYFGYEVELPGERHSLFAPLDKLYRYLSIGTFHKDYPIPALLFAPGLFAILYLFVFAYRIAYGQIEGVLPFLPLALTWCTVLLGPTYLVRYVVYLWFAFPLLFVAPRNLNKTGRYGII